jgi:hypothetical protein
MWRLCRAIPRRTGPFMRGGRRLVTRLKRTRAMKLPQSWRAARIVLLAAAAFGAGCASGVGPATAPADDGLAGPRPGRQLAAVSGTHPIDPVLAQQFRSLRLQHSPSLRPASAGPLPGKTHAFWAIWPDANSGIEAQQVIWPNLVVTLESDVIYAPTTYPAPEACIESTTAYEAKPFGLEIWAWDWCSSNPNGKVGRAVTVDGKFLRTYTQALDGTRAYLVRIEETDPSKNEWTDYLYNYAKKSWNVFYVSSGAADIAEQTGWDAYETYSKIDKRTGRSFMCADVAAVGPIVSQGLRIRTPSGWKLTNANDSYVGPDGNFYCPLKFSVPIPNSKYSVSHR